MALGARRTFLLALVAACASCDPAPEERTPLTLQSIRPRPDRDELLLNDDLRLTFSEPIDPTSVTSDSVRLVAESTGKAAHGDWVVDGRSIRFLPRGVRTAALTDGGFRPGGRYRITLVGFPAMGSIRSTTGASLARSLTATFSVVPLNATDGRPVFRDASPDSASPLRIESSEDGASDNLPLRYDAALRIACNEPLDPRSLDPDEFEIVQSRLSADPRDQADQEPIRIRRVFLERNVGEGVLDPTLGAKAVIRLEPARRLPLRDGSFAKPFVLRRRAEYSGTGVTDLSGGKAYSRPIPFFAARFDALAPERTGTYVFDFDTDEDFAPVLDPTSDGTAHWADTGRVRIRFPAAAGLGIDGDVTLDGTCDRDDVQATHLVIPEGAEVDLAPVDAAGETGGLVVLRAQGRIDLKGTLRRRIDESAGAPPMWSRSGGDRSPPVWSAPPRALTTWLEEARERDLPWTVIIAGGDLVVTGEIDVDTPLLIVAGGRIRGAGRPRTAKGQMWLLGEGGGFKLEHHVDPSASSYVEAPLFIDEPILNPLAKPLVFVAISSKVPKGVTPDSWGAPTVIASDGRAGAARVQYLAGDALKGGEEGVGQAVRYAEPNGVLEPGSAGGNLRLRIELVARPGPGLWKPPYVDRVQLDWSPNAR